MSHFHKFLIDSYQMNNDVQEGNFEWKRFIIYRTSGSSRTLYKCIRASSTKPICTTIATITTLFPMLTSRTCLQFRCWWCRTVRSIRTFIFNYTTWIMKFTNNTTDPPANSTTCTKWTFTWWKSVIWKDPDSNSNVTWN